MLKREKDKKNSGQRNVRTKKERELLPVVVAEVRCKMSCPLRGQYNQRNEQLEAEGELLCGGGC